MNIFQKIVRRFSGRIDFSKPAHELLYLILDKLQKHALPRASESDPSVKLLRQDFIMSDLVPIAVAIVALKKESQ